MRLFGLSAQGADDGVGAAVLTARRLGASLGMINIYRAWVWNASLPVEALSAIEATGAIPEITWEPWDPREGRTQARFAPCDIAAGVHDEYIDGWAQAAASYDKPLLLRFAHEMNGGWYPWSPASGGGTCENYVAAFRHVHDVFARAGAHHVKWVWCPNVVRGMPVDLEALWPGREFVDYLALDGFNGGSGVPSMGGWKWPRELFSESLRRISRLNPSLPVLINETACAQGEAESAAWIADLFLFLAGQRRVLGVVWFNFDKRAEADWRIDASESSRQVATRALSSW